MCKLQTAHPPLSHSKSSLYTNHLHACKVNYQSDLLWGMLEFSMLCAYHPPGCVDRLGLTYDWLPLAYRPRCKSCSFEQAQGHRWYNWSCHCRWQLGILRCSALTCNRPENTLGDRLRLSEEEETVKHSALKLILCTCLEHVQCSTELHNCFQAS